MWANTFQNRVAGYLAAVLGIAAVTAICAPFHDHLNHMTVALALLLVVLFVATVWGSWPALLASVLGMLCFNFFFLPPVYTFTIADPQNWVALAAFSITAITAGQLSRLAKRRAAEAAAARKETRLRSAYNRSLLEATLLDENDEYFHLADLPAYLEMQAKAGAAYNDRTGWTRMAILNVARIGKFSSDRTIKEYARGIWDIKAI